MNKKDWLLLIGALIMQCVLLVMLAGSDGQTIDEAAHLSSGASYLTTGSFNLNPEHPAFVKILAGSSALLSGADVPVHDPSWAAGDQWNFGRAFLYHNTVPTDTLLFLGRLPIIIMSLLLTLGLFLLARVLLGTRASYVVLLLGIVEPTLLAHGHYVTTDVPFTLFFFLSITYIWWTFHTQSSFAALIAGVMIGLAHITKFSAVLLWPILLVLGSAALLHTQDWRNTLKRFGEIFGFGLIATALFVFFIYGFSSQKIITDPLVNDFYDQPETRMTNFPFGELIGGKSTLATIIQSFAHNVPIPAYDYFRGLGNVATHNYNGHTAYLLGEQSNAGWWWYFPVAFAVKTPAGIMVLAGLGMLTGMIMSARRRNEFTPKKWDRRLREWYRSLPLAAILFTLAPLLYLLISLGSHINLGVRHMLPIMPFILLLTGVPFLMTGKRFQRAYRAVLWSIVALTVLSIGIAAPYFTSYFSEFVGGWPQGPRYLLDSNYDWGQDIKRLKKFLNDASMPEPIRFAYFGSADIPAYFERGFAALPTDTEVAQKGIPKNGTVVISAGIYHSLDTQYTWLYSQPIDTVIGTSLYVFIFP
ncbi:MAG: glycosyltransferase family 39 protein [Patescibacteria group bacterium]|jgi:4-amino-4-deoxy-L-arabinose transferase-like glycosyltransferase